MTFDEIIAPLPREQFLSEYWTKNFLHLRGDKGRFEPLLTWEKLNEILEWQNPPPLIKLWRGGSAIDPRVYIDNMEKQPEARQLNVGRLIASISQGAALLIDGIQRNVPAVKGLSELFEEAFQTPNQVNLYASWGAQNAFNLHWDSHEVFVLQLSGRKHWKIYPPTRPYPLSSEAEKPPEPTGQPTWDGIVEDGDILYFPRGWWHVVRPMNEPSLHLTVGVHPATGADFLGWWLPQLLRHSEARQDLPLGGDAAETKEHFARLLNIMSRGGRDETPLDQFLREWSAFRRTHAHVRLPIAPAEQLSPLEMTTRVRLAHRASLSIEYKAGDRAAKFHAGGGQFEVPPHVVPALKQLLGLQSHTVREICQGNEAPHAIKDILDTLGILAGAGVILKETA